MIFFYCILAYSVTFTVCYYWSVGVSFYHILYLSHSRTHNVRVSVCRISISLTLLLLVLLLLLLRAVIRCASSTSSTSTLCYSISITNSHSRSVIKIEALTTLCQRCHCCHCIPNWIAASSNLLLLLTLWIIVPGNFTAYRWQHSD